MEHDTTEPQYTEEQLRLLRNCLTEWKSIQDLPARQFWQLDLDQLGTVELAAAADRFEAAGAGQDALKALEKVVARPARDLCINYRDVYRDLVASYRQTGEYERASEHQRRFIEYLRAQTPSEASPEADQEQMELDRLECEDGEGQRLLANEPTLTGRYLGVSRELAERLRGGPFRPRTTRSGNTIDWVDYLEEIRVHLNHRMCSWATPSSLLVTSETLLVEGLLWTVLTRPEEAVISEINDFVRAVAALRMRRPETISADIRQSYEAFVTLVRRFQDSLDLYRAITERYFTDRYDATRQPIDLLKAAAGVVDSAPLIARSSIGEAGALLLIRPPADSRDMLSAAPSSIDAWTRVVSSVVRIAQRDNLLPLDSAKDERAAWGRFVDEDVPLNTPLNVPNLSALGAQVHPERAHVETVASAGRDRVARTAAPTSAKRVKVGRNEPCPCGSGKKYKKCCGR